MKVGSRRHGRHLLRHQGDSSVPNAILVRIIDTTVDFFAMALPRIHEQFGAWGMSVSCVD